MTSSRSIATCLKLLVIAMFGICIFAGYFIGAHGQCMAGFDKPCTYCCQVGFEASKKCKCCKYEPDCVMAGGFLVDYGCVGHLTGCRKKSETMLQVPI